jgi:N-acetylmuramoyl-L-alanine amidase
MKHEIERIIVHCSQSQFGDVPTIRDWHVNGNGWRDIGYNLVILNGHPKNSTEFISDLDGRIEEGRALDFSAYIESDEKAAHTLGYNHNSIGTCLIGDSKFTIQQFKSLFYSCKTISRIAKNPNMPIEGHYEMPTAKGKTCPNFDMDHFRRLLKADDPRDEAIVDHMGTWLK